MELSKNISIRRRYSRSVNLERDLERADSVLGYVLTQKGREILERVVQAAKDTRSVAAYTLTGVYGTGKSAFAHYFSALVSEKSGAIYKNAIQILIDFLDANDKNKKSQTNLLEYFQKQIPHEGMLKAVVTAAREPIAFSILKAIDTGVQIFYTNKRGAKPSFIKEIETQLNIAKQNPEDIEPKAIFNIIEAASSSAGGLLIIIDEMGKTLEYAATSSINAKAASDLYFLQQLAELSIQSSTQKKNKILFFGLLHQAFDEYAGNMTPSHRNEWAKVQGRFEDIPFYESPEETLAIMGYAIEHIDALKEASIQGQLNDHAITWVKELQNNSAFSAISAEVYSKLYPLHPISARLLPILCQKFAQNDRSLFTFLAGQEPHSLGMFLNEYLISIENGKVSTWPSLKLHRLYDYFIESSGIGFRPGFQRWVEIQEKVEEARYYGVDHQNVIKTIGLLNLLSTGGALKAEKELTILALLDSPLKQNTDSGIHSREYWLSILNDLEKKGLIVYRKGLNEYRIWQGSDFNIEKALSEVKQNIKTPLGLLLNQNFPMRPLIAQKHSYNRGILRYFQRVFIDATTDIEKIIDEFSSSKHNPDGFLFYYVDHVNYRPLPEFTHDNKAILCMVPQSVNVLRSVILEYDALNTVRKEIKRLQLDKVAEKEVDQRIYITEKILTKTIDQLFQNTNNTKNAKQASIVYHGDVKYFANTPAALNALLSDTLNQTYSRGIALHNELIHRRDLTSQGAKAQRLLMEAMFLAQGQERLGLTGFGPETAIFESLLIQTEIYIKSDDRWLFQYPNPKNSLYKALKEIEKFCLSKNKKSTRTGNTEFTTIRDLYAQMEKPPFGVSRALMPLLFLVVLLQHSDTLSLYHNGTFVPVVGQETIELLLKRPENFSVKHFDIGGLKGSYFKELETVFQRAQKNTQLQNASLLQVVKPFIKFIQHLPKYTKQTSYISKKSRQLIRAIENAREPDKLLFEDIPVALGFIVEGEDISDQLDAKFIQSIKVSLVKSLQEIQGTYKSLLDKLQDFIFHYFSISSEKDKLREELRVRARRLEKGAMEPLLRRFILAAQETPSNDEPWLEALIMVIADKPANSFKDEDIENYEMNMAQIARRFQNLESLVLKAGVSKIGNTNLGFEARKITVTKPDGYELDEVVWVDNKNKKKLDSILDELFKTEPLMKSEKNQKALLSLMADRVLENNIVDEISKLGTKKIKIDISDKNKKKSNS